MLHDPGLQELEALLRRFGWRHVITLNEAEMRDEVFGHFDRQVAGALQEVLAALHHDGHTVKVVVAVAVVGNERRTRAHAAGHHQVHAGPPDAQCRRAIALVLCVDPERLHRLAGGVDVEDVVGCGHHRAQLARTPQLGAVLGAVEQQIELASESNHCGYASVSYLGGAGPLQRVSFEQLEHLAMRVRDSLPLGAKGWIGIDFLIPDEMQSSQNLVVIEINPRLTTSYLGYRQWYGHALANSLVGIFNCSELNPRTIFQTSELSSWDYIATR